MNAGHDADRILLRGLRDLGVRLNDDVLNFSDLSSDQTLESAARCLNAIAARTQAAPHPPYQNVEVAPASTSARYNLADKLVSDCVKLGFPDSEGLGQQTFLHGSEAELRSVFSFLLDKILKDEDVDQDKSIFGKPSALNANEEDQDDDDGWDDVPSFDLAEMDPSLVDLLPKESRNAAFNLIQQAKREKKIREGQSQPTKDVDRRIESSNDAIVEDLDKGGEESIVQEECKAVGDIAKSEESDRLEKELDDRLQNAMEKFKSAQLEYLLIRDDIVRMRKEIKVMTKKDEELAASIDKRQAELDRRTKVLQLLPSGEENLERLQAIVAKSEAKLAAMNEQWEAAKKDLDEEHEELLASSKAKLSSLSEEEKTLALLQQQIEDADRKLAEKEVEEMHYLSALNKRKSGEPRSLYTKRILDMLNSVKKQREETDKVIEDIRQTQKDINMLEGKLHRTHAEVDMTVFEVARNDPALASAYKMVTDLHQQCVDIVETVRKSGKVKRATRDINDQIEAEKAKGMEDKMAKMREDLEAIRTENKALEERLASS